jgi:hypothetical protein
VAVVEQAALVARVEPVEQAEQEALAAQQVMLVLLGGQEKTVVLLLSLTHGDYLKPFLPAQK